MLDEDLDDLATLLWAALRNQGCLSSRLNEANTAKKVIPILKGHLLTFFSQQQAQQDAAEQQ